jgi:hypothetical protein
MNIIGPRLRRDFVRHASTELKFVIFEIETTIIYLVH